MEAFREEIDVEEVEVPAQVAQKNVHGRVAELGWC